MQGAMPIAPRSDMSRFTKTKPANLTLSPNKSDDNAVTTPQPSPMNLTGIDLLSFGGGFGSGLLDLPALPQSPPTSPRLNSKENTSSTFLPTLNSRTTSEQDQRADPPPPRRMVKDDEEYRPNSSSMSKIYHLRKNPGSTPELSLVGSAENGRKQSEEANVIQASETRSQPSPSPYQQQEDTSSTKRREKGFRNPLARTKSTRRDSNSKPKPSDKNSFDRPPKTAPLHSDWQNSSEMLLKARGDQRRGKSAERTITSESEDNVPMDRQTAREPKEKSAFVTGSKNVMNKAKSGGGSLLNRLGKIGRTGSDKQVPDSEFVQQVINLPLIEQTRITRISKDLGSCRDKTEYWMPSLPWRCIDYLNLNCESEGLYRVPGSGPQVKQWQRRFDTELDVDLLDEKELYDPNIIGSMLKSWLRDLPTEIFPKAQQQALADDLFRNTPPTRDSDDDAPQKLRDALSLLPPFNYYLLFAITCHLSLLLSHKDKNKMDLNNLSICIGPCLDLQGWLFNYLVGDWRHCWQGCFTEKHFLEIEKAYEQGLDYEPTEVASQVTRASESAVSDASPSTSRQGSPDQQTPRIEKHTNHLTSNGNSNSNTATPQPAPPSSSSSRRAENTRPTNADPLPDYSRYVNGGVLTPERKFIPQPLELFSHRRPCTAVAAEIPEYGAPVGGAGGMSRPKFSSHSRSHSEVPSSPTAAAPMSTKTTTATVDFPFKVRNT